MKKKNVKDKETKQHTHQQESENERGKENRLACTVQCAKQNKTK